MANRNRKEGSNFIDELLINPLAELSQRILDSSNGLVFFVVNVL